MDSLQGVPDVLGELARSFVAEQPVTAMFFAAGIPEQDCRRGGDADVRLQSLVGLVIVGDIGLQ
jgi:hypothetical protein